MLLLTIVATATFELVYTTAKPELAVAPGLKSAALTVLEGIAEKLIDCERRTVIGLPAPTAFESNGKFDTIPVPFISSQPTSKIAERV